MVHGQKKRNVRAASAAAALLCLAAGPVLASGGWTAAELLDPEQSILGPIQVSPFPLSRSASAGGLSFDLGGSEERKLEMRLAEPLALGTVLSRKQTLLGGTEISLGGTLGWLANEDFGLTLNSSQTTTADSFQALGSIHCQNGVLDSDSFTASNCYFIDQPGALNIESLSLGADFRPTEYSRAGISLFRQDAHALDMTGRAGGALTANPLSVALGNPVLAPFSGQASNAIDSEITGIDLEFQLGVSTNRAGDISLGLQLTRILEANVDMGYPGSGVGLGAWNLDGPADSARVSFDWNKGAFSGGVESYYRAPIEFMNRGGLDSVTTFDVHFTWRTPWNANLSVGASNLLNSGGETSVANETNLADPFESIYGRIPYVRYEQDL